MNLKIISLVVLFLMVTMSFSGSNSILDLLEEENTSMKVIVPLNSANIPGHQEGSIYTYTTLSSGRNHNCAILADNSVSCWGNNGGTFSGGFGTIRSAVSISAGGYHACAILDNGTVSCSGSNGNGQLGDGTNTNSNSPVMTSSFGTGRTAIAVSSGTEHTCAILDDGSVSCWGSNGDGQLGDGSYTDRNTPVQTSSIGMGRTAVAISSGAYHTCIIVDNGSVSCWVRRDWFY